MSGLLFGMGDVDYSGPLAEAYDRGRRLPPATTRIWIEAARRHLPTGSDPVLDLGAGTGRFLRALGEGLGAPIVGLEPAAGMRALAMEHIGPAISLVGGTASKLPFASDVFRGVWASQVLHHVTDLEGCALELRRVIKQGGRVLVRGMYEALPTQWPLVRYFPGVVSVHERFFSSLEQMRIALLCSGFSELAHECIEQVVAEDAESFYERTAQRADSGLVLLSDSDFKAGLATLRHEIDHGRCIGPISEILDLVVFG
ncbi:MAG TPA: class I SAM-dependent methyltransferase [Acidimicrobiales bacterium]|nr:class I SAM-dependent methyltransferase [Acidimicrobiales bacterium]